MKILSLVQRFFPVMGGAESQTKIFMDYLAKNHKVNVFTTNAYDVERFWNKNSREIREKIDLNYNVNRFSIITSTEIKFDKSCERLPLLTNHPGPFLPNLWEKLILEKLDFDLIFATSFPYDHLIPAYISAKKWKLPIIFQPLIHQEFPELYFSPIRLTMLNNSDGIFVISNSEKKILLENGITDNKISIIKPYVPLEKYTLLPTKKIKKKFPSKKIVLYTGLKSYVKGIFHLIEAMDILWKSREDVLLLLVGPSTIEFDQYFSKLSDSTRKKILDLGVVEEEEKFDALSSCDILVLPSKSESFGLAFIEAWAFEKPIIGCNIPAVSELVENMKNGLLFEFGNISELSQKIYQLLNDHKLSTKLGKAGKKKAFLFSNKENLQLFEKKCKLIVDEFKK